MQPSTGLRILRLKADFRPTCHFHPPNEDRVRPKKKKKKKKKIKTTQKFRSLLFDFEAGFRKHKPTNTEEFGGIDQVELSRLTSIPFNDNLLLLLLLS